MQLYVVDEDGNIVYPYEDTKKTREMKRVTETFGSQQCDVIVSSKEISGIGMQHQLSNAPWKVIVFQRNKDFFGPIFRSVRWILIFGGGMLIFMILAVFFATKVENNGESSRKIGVSEIWYRLPKFILGFFAASLIASFIAVPAFGKETVSSINSVLDQYKNWAFVLAFTSIGLETNFREIKEQFQGGKPLTLYVVGQLFNIVLTFAAVYLLLSGKFFPLPNLAL